MNGATPLGSQSSGGVRLPRLGIALGSSFAVTVIDVRRNGPWAEETEPGIKEEDRAIIFHHSASQPPDARGLFLQLARLQLLRAEWPFGIPYNFLVEPFAPFRIWYLNDVDQAWPHTSGHNHHTAVAAWGNFDEVRPPRGLPARMHRLADALATMWGHWVPEMQHRDVYATRCPGAALGDMLRR